MTFFKDTEVFLSRGIKLLLFLIPFLPLYISTSLVFPYITGKNFAFRVLIELAAALWLTLVAINKKKWFRNSPMLVTLLFFTFIVGLADLLGVNPYKSFWSNYERMEGYITVLHLLLYFLVLKNVLRTKRDWVIFFNILMIGSVLVSLFTFLIPIPVEPTHYSRYVMEYGTRVHSTIGNPPFLASYLLLSILIGFILIFNTQKPYLKFVYISIVLLHSAAIYLTGSRGAMLAGASGVIIGLFFILKRKNIFRKKLVLTSIVFIVLAVGFIVHNYSDSMKNERDISPFAAMLSNPHDMNIYRFVTLFSDPAVKTRLDTWRIALNGIKERPLLGWGQGNFAGIYTVNPIPLAREYTWLDRAHNIVIDWLVSAGFLGLFSYLAIFVVAFYFIRSAFHKRKIQRAEAVIIFTALVVYFVQNLFTFDTINTYFIFFALLAYIDNLEFIGEPSVEGSRDNIKADKLKVRYLGTLFVALLVFSGTCYYLNYKPMEKSRYIIKMGLSSPENDSYSLLLDDFNHALSINAFGDEFLRKSMLSVSSKILTTKHFDHEGALKFIEVTLRELEKGIILNRYNMEYLTNVIIFFNKIAAYEKSYIARTEALIKESKGINPEYQWLDMIMTDVFILKKDYEGAFSNIKGIVDMDLENEENLLKLALVSTYASKEEPLNQALEKLKEIRLSRDENMISKRKSFLALTELYQLAIVNKEIENYPEALKYLNDIIMILSYEERAYFDEDFRFYRPEAIARIHLDIARIYSELDNKEAASGEAEKALKIDGNLSDAKTLIDSINN